MNKQELIERIEGLPFLYLWNRPYLNKEVLLEFVKQLDESETGHADEAPRYVKNILARLRELPAHDREVWLKAIMGEFEQDFSCAKWREGYEQGKFEGKYIPEKVVVPQFVAVWYEENKDDFETNLLDFIENIPNIYEKNEFEMFEGWLLEANTKPFQTLVNMHQFGYEVEKEKRYVVVMPNVSSSRGVLTRIKHDDSWIWIDTLGTIVEGRTHTRKELEEAGFGWVFDCPGVEVEEVE